MDEFQLNFKIKQLEEQLEMEKIVKKSEVLMNSDLKDRIAKLEMQLDTVVDINNKYAEKLIKLQNQLKKLYGL